MNMKNPLSQALLLTFAVSVLGCDYLLPEGIEVGQHRITVQQGNALDEAQVRELRIGMTPQQVLFLLGSPLVVSPLHSNRWSYPYYLEGREVGESKLDRVSLIFENDKVAQILRLVPIDPEATDASGSLTIEDDLADAASGDAYGEPETN